MERNIFEVKRWIPFDYSLEALFLSSKIYEKKYKIFEVSRMAPF